MNFEIKVDPIVNISYSGQDTLSNTDSKFIKPAPHLKFKALLDEAIAGDTESK